MQTHELFHTLHQLSRHLTNQLNDVLSSMGLYSSQWAVIYVLKTRGSLTQKELCEYLFVEAPPMTRTIQRLVRLGYVKQIQGKDRRQKYIELTDAALKEYPKWEKAVFECNESLVKDFPVELRDELFRLQATWLRQLL